jgi:hypothetical protein
LLFQQSRSDSFQLVQERANQAVRPPQHAGTLPVKMRSQRIRRTPRTRGLTDRTLAARPRQHADNLASNPLRIGIEVEQDAHSDALILAHQREQNVLRADVVVPERQRLAQRKLEHLLRARRERDLAGGDLLARADDAHNLAADALEREVEALQHTGRQALLFAQQAKQDVFGANVVVLERAGFFLGQHDNVPGALCEPLKHSPPIVRTPRLPAKSPPHCHDRVGDTPVMWAP